MATEATNINQFIKEVNTQLATFAKRIPDALTVVALDARALIKNRVIQRGNMVSASNEEVSFPPYSVQYAKKKARDNKPNRLVLTGKMLESWQIIGSTFQNGKYVVQMGASDQESQRKVNYNSDHYGDILNLTKKEQKQLIKVFDAELTKALNP